MHCPPHPLVHACMLACLLRYFSASAAVIATCIAGYSVLPLLPYGRYKLLLAGIIDDPKVWGLGHRMVLQGHMFEMM